jgi:hypothetical protein
MDMGGKPLSASTEKHGIMTKVTSCIIRVCPIPPKPRIELLGISGRLKAFNRKNRLLYLGASTIFILFGCIIVANTLAPPTLPAFNLQIKDCYYNASTEYFSVWGTFGIQVPKGYNYYLRFVSITDGNTIIDVSNYRGLKSKVFGSYALYPSPEAYQEGPDWHFYIPSDITLASTNLHLTFGYSISYGQSENRQVLETGTKTFPVSVT